MKKMLVMILLVAVMLTGCGTAKDTTKDNGAPTGNVIHEDIIEEDVIYEDVLMEDVIVEEVIIGETTWISDEYQAEVNYNSQENNWGK